MKIYVVKINENLKRIDYMSTIRREGVFTFEDSTTHKELALDFDNEVDALDFIEKNNLQNWHIATPKTIDDLNWFEFNKSKLQMTNALIDLLKVKLARELLIGKSPVIVTILQNELNYFLKVRRQNESYC